MSGDDMRWIVLCRPLIAEVIPAQHWLAADRPGAHLSLTGRTHLPRVGSRLVVCGCSVLVRKLRV
jgi:hypothetical protein